MPTDNDLSQVPPCNLVVFRYNSETERVEKGRCTAPKGHPSEHEVSGD